jgi:CheY-like chemotaxis protein
MRVQSMTGKGSTFSVLLNPVTADPAQASAGQPTADRPAAATSKARILAIDDEEMMLRLIQRVLRDHDVVVLKSAREALAQLAEGEKYDLILSDMMMPAMTGKEFFEVLIEKDPEMARKIVFLSGGAITTAVDEFLDSVPNTCIAKPVDVGTLRETVRQLLIAST